MAAPIPAPPAKPANAPTPMAIPLPNPQKFNEPLVLEHLVATTPIPAPVPATATPTMNALRSRWLSSNRVTRITSFLLIPTWLSPSRSCIASSLTVENVPLCSLRFFSTTSILWPACNVFSASHEFLFVSAWERTGFPATSR